MGGSVSRLADAIRAVIRELFPHLELLGPKEYRVAAVHSAGAFVDATPVDGTLGLPPISRVPFLGAPGLAAEVQLGSRVLVQFVDASPAKPVVTATEGADGSGFVPTSARLDASGTVRIGEHATLVDIGSGAESVPPANPAGRPVCYGDTVQLGTASGVITLTGPTVARVKLR